MFKNPDLSKLEQIIPISMCKQKLASQLLLEKEDVKNRDRRLVPVGDAQGYVVIMDSSSNRAMLDLRIFIRALVDANVITLEDIREAEEEILKCGEGADIEQLSKIFY